MIAQQLLRKFCSDYDSIIISQLQERVLPIELH